MNSTAESGTHVDPASSKPSDTFQSSYASVLASLQSVNSELQSLMAKLQARPHLNSTAAAAATPAGVAVPAVKLGDGGSQSAIVTPAAASPAAVLFTGQQGSAADDMARAGSGGAASCLG